MSDFTIEQLEALKEGTTPGPWEASVQAFAENEGGGYSLHAEVTDKDGAPLMYAEDGFVFHKEPNFTLAAAAPALVDALIAEKQAHQKLRAEVEKLRDVHWEKYKELDQHVTWLERQCGVEPVRDSVAQEAEDERKAAARLAQILEGNDG